MAKELSQGIKVFAVKTNEFDPSGVHGAERENNSFRLSSDFPIYAVVTQSTHRPPRTSSSRKYIYEMF